MNIRSGIGVLAAVLASMGLLVAGCGDQRNSGETVGQKVDRTADKMANATDQAATRAGAAMDDATITAKVKSAILAEPGLRSLQIDVDTKNAVVALNGTVDKPELKARAAQIAQSVGGVRSVQDNLVVKPTQSG
jgi:hyperosmotically inducible protein